jgi:hypothetical protein
VRRWECDTDMPKPGPLPQTSQWLATMASSVGSQRLPRVRSLGGGGAQVAKKLRAWAMPDNRPSVAT